MPSGILVHKVIAEQPTAVKTGKPEETKSGEFIQVPVKNVPKSATRYSISPKQWVQFGLCIGGTVAYGAAVAAGGPFLGSYLATKGLSDGAIAGVLVSVFGLGPICAIACPVCFLNVKHALKPTKGEINGN